MKYRLAIILFCVMALLWSCPESDEYRHLALGGSKYSSTTIPAQLYTADAFFWGTWISMADGKAYTMEENRIKVGDKLYWNQAGTGGDKLVAADLGTFEKQSDSVIINNSIPYFRKGGANLEYKLKLVGFSGSRAGATAIPLPNTKVSTKSASYATFTDDATTDASGEVSLIAPTANDIQTVTVQKNEGGTVVVPNVKIETTGSNMGTIAVVDEGDYSLKVYGNVTDKDDGYMYADKWYQLTLVITNISEVTAETSFVTVSTDDENLLFDKAQSESFEVKSGQAVSTLTPGMTKTIQMKVQYQNIDDGYADTELKVTIENTATKQVWEDFVPLRFFKGQYHWTINALATEQNKNAALHGFLVYPDKVCQYFDINHGSFATIKVPSFGQKDRYLLVFSGAVAGGTLDQSTEMYFTVQEGDSPMTIDVSDKNSISFGGDNNSEDAAYEVNDDAFQAYLSAGKVKYFGIFGKTAH